jgi:hypothetical protein
MTTNTIGSHVAYAAYSGCKVSIYGDYCSPTKNDYRNDPYYQKYPELLNYWVDQSQKSVIKKRYPEFFTVPMEATERKDWGAEVVGAAYRKEPQEIATLLGWSTANQILGYCREGLRIASSPSSLRNLFERRRIAKQS